MYNLKTFASKIIANLRIPSEREIRELQLRQVMCALKQSNDSTKGAVNAQLKSTRRILPVNMPENNKYATKNANAFVKGRIEKSASA